MEDKMKTTTVIANDTSSAMDDIISKLGDDAVILSTKHKDGKVHMTDDKLRELLNVLPQNIKLGTWRQPPPAMPDYCKHKDSIISYHKYYANEKKGFAKWTNRERPAFMEQYA